MYFRSPFAIFKDNIFVEKKAFIADWKHMLRGEIRTQLKIYLNHGEFKIAGM